MRSKISLIVLPALLLVAACQGESTEQKLDVAAAGQKSSASSAPDLQGWQFYSNAKHAFSFKYPAGWEMHGEQNLESCVSKCTFYFSALLIEKASTPTSAAYGTEGYASGEQISISVHTMMDADNKPVNQKQWLSLYRKGKVPTWLRIGSHTVLYEKTRPTSGSGPGWGYNYTMFENNLVTTVGYYSPLEQEDASMQARLQAIVSTLQFESEAQSKK